MDFFNLFHTVLESEIKHFNLDLDGYKTLVANFTGELDADFGSPYNRCAYMHRNASCNLFFMKSCVESFLSRYPDSKDLISFWKSLPDAKLCSISCGPGLDYLAFILALSKDGNQGIFKSVYVLSECGAWRNTVSFIENAARDPVNIRKMPVLLNYKNIKVVQGNLWNGFPTKWTTHVKNSQVFLMMKALNILSRDPSREISMSETMHDLVSTMEPLSTIFCLDTEPSLELFSKTLSKFSGKYLHEPCLEINKLPENFPSNFASLYGCTAIMSARGMFFVWQKLEGTPPQTCISPVPLCDLRLQNTIAHIIIPNVVESEPDSSHILEEWFHSHNTEAFIKLSQYTSGLSKIVQSNEHLNSSSSNITANLNNTSNTPPVNDTSLVRKMGNVLTANDDVTNPLFSVRSSKVKDLPKAHLCHSVSMTELSTAGNTSGQTNATAIQGLFRPSSKTLISNTNAVGNISPIINKNISYHSTPIKSEAVKQKLTTKSEKSSSLKTSLASKWTQTKDGASNEKSNSHTAIKGLTGKVKSLVSSFEKSVVTQVPPVDFNEHRDPRNCSQIKEDYACSQSHACSMNTADPNRPSRPAFCCNPPHASRCHSRFCANLTYFNHSHFNACCEHGISTCSQLNPAMTINTPSIVIPLQNIDIDTLSKLLLSAKKSS